MILFLHNKRRYLGKCTDSCGSNVSTLSERYQVLFYIATFYIAYKFGDPQRGGNEELCTEIELFISEFLSVHFFR